MTDQDNNDFLRADIYRNLSSSLAGSLHSVFGGDSRRSSFVLEGELVLSDCERRDMKHDRPRKHYTK